MRCVRCDRPLLHPAKTIDSKRGPLMWGPVCALKAGLIEPPTRQRALVTHHQAQEVDENQLTLELAA
jgi:hypothetical protein